jgi:hypothetical protein
MSAQCRFAPKADIDRRDEHVRLVPIADIPGLIDHLVGAGAQRRRHVEIESFSRL